jgi:hypothetical protein
MSPSECAKLLRQHQAWRRFDGDIPDTPPMLSPKVIGEAIDAAISIVDQFGDATELVKQTLPHVETIANAAAVLDGLALELRLTHAMPSKPDVIPDPKIALKYRRIKRVVDELYDIAVTSAPNKETA